MYAVTQVCGTSIDSMHCQSPISCLSIDNGDVTFSDLSIDLAMMQLHEAVVTLGGSGPAKPGTHVYILLL